MQDYPYSYKVFFEVAKKEGKNVYTLDPSQLGSRPEKLDEVR